MLSDLVTKSPIVEVFFGQDLDPDRDVHGEPTEFMSDKPGVDGPPIQGGKGVYQRGGFDSQGSGCSRTEAHVLMRAEMTSLGLLKTV
jgi:hypothetical protein